jgi:hypothetical protein
MALVLLLSQAAKYLLNLFCDTICSNLENFIILFKKLWGKFGFKKNNYYLCELESQ